MVTRPEDTDVIRTLTQLVRRVYPNAELRINENDDPFESPYTWDGRVLRRSERGVMEAVHDAVHIVMASKRRRVMPEFGLGADPANDSDAMSVVVYVYSRAEECHVCNVELALDLVLGYALEDVEHRGSWLGTELPRAEDIAAARRWRPQAFTTTQWRRLRGVTRRPEVCVARAKHEAERSRIIKKVMKQNQNQEWVRSMANRIAQ